MIQNKNIFIFVLVFLFTISIVNAYDGDFCNANNTPCSLTGNATTICTSTDLSEMYNNYDWDIDSSNVGDISGWNTSCITNMDLLFIQSNFNQDISNWDTSSVTSMYETFMLTTYFNQPIGSWNTSSVTNMREMFRSANSFSQDLNNWDTSKVTTMYQMFYGSPNPDISDWNTSSVTAMYRMFYINTVFNDDISSWDTGNVLIFDEMFRGASSFNQPLNSWDTKNVTSMYGMFRGASSFNQNLSNWNVSSLTSASLMFSGSGLDTPNYDSLLQGWSSQVVNNAVPFSAGTTQYTDQSSRDILTGTYSWSITDGGLAPLPVCTGSCVINSWNDLEDIYSPNIPSFYADGLQSDTVYVLNTSSFDWNFNGVDNNYILIYDVSNVDFSCSDMTQIVNGQLYNLFFIGGTVNNVTIHDCNLSANPNYTNVGEYKYGQIFSTEDFLFDAVSINEFNLHDVYFYGSRLLDIYNVPLTNINFSNIMGVYDTGEFITIQNGGFGANGTFTDSEFTTGSNDEAGIWYKDGNSEMISSNNITINYDCTEFYVRNDSGACGEFEGIPFYVIGYYDLNKCGLENGVPANLNFPVDNGTIVACVYPELKSWSDLSNTDSGNWISSNAVRSNVFNINDNLTYFAGTGIFGVYDSKTNITTDYSSRINTPYRIEEMVLDTTNNVIYMAIGDYNVLGSGSYGVYDVESGIYTEYENNLATVNTISVHGERLYVGRGTSYNGGDGLFGYYNLTSNTFVDLTSSDTGNVFTGNRINNLIVTNNGLVLIGLDNVANNNFGVYNPDTNVWSDFSSSVSSNGIESMAYDSNNDITFLGFANGYFGSWNVQTETYNLLINTGTSPINDKYVSGLVFDESNNLVYLGMGISPTNSYNCDGSFGYYNLTSNTYTDLSTRDPDDWASNYCVNSLSIDEELAIYTSLDSGRFGVYNKVFSEPVIPPTPETHYSSQYGWIIFIMMIIAGLIIVGGSFYLAMNVSSMTFTQIMMNIFAILIGLSMVIALISLS
jgi:surface protein